MVIKEETNKKVKRRKGKLLLVAPVNSDGEGWQASCEVVKRNEVWHGKKERGI